MIEGISIVMKLRLSRNPRPQKKAEELLAAFFPHLHKEDVKGAFVYDLDPHKPRCRCKGLVAVTADTLFLARQGEEIRSYALEGVAEVICQSCVGCVRVIFRDRAGVEHVLCRATAACRTNILVAVKAINRLLAKEGEGAPLPHEAPSRQGRTCPKCGRPYPRGGAVCLHCVGRLKTFMRLVSLAKPYKLWIAASVLLFFAVSGINLITPYLNKLLVDDFIGNPTVSLNRQLLFSFGLIIFLIFMASLLQRALSLVRGYCLIRAGNLVIVSLRDTLFRKIQSLSIARISRRTSGELMGRVTGDTAVLQRFVSNRLADLLEQVFLFLAVTVILFIYNWRLALLVLLPAPFVVLSFRLFSRFMRGMFRRRWQLSAEARATLHDTFSGIRVVKCFGTEHREAARFDEISRKERDAQIRQEKYWAVLMPLLQFCMGAGEFAVLYFVGNRILGGSMTLGDMTMFSSYVGMVYAPLRAFAHLPREIMNVMTSATKIFELLDEESDVFDDEHALSPLIQGGVRFEHVSFGYEEGVEVLHDICLDVKPGEFIGLVGRSGVGKSTLINLVMRLYDAEEGQILIDGIDIRRISQETLRSQMGVVLQETFLFSGTVAQNIAYARPDASYDEIMAAAKQAGCHKFVSKLPDGYQTKVGERGYTLSGGERQRIAIARALLHKPRVLILDEATSSLDTETERDVQQALAILCRDCTTIAIAHRLSTLRNATRLVVLDNQRVAQTGTHEELMAQEGIYRDLVMAQREMTRMKSTERE